MRHLEGSNRIGNNRGRDCVTCNNWAQNVRRISLVQLIQRCPEEWEAVRARVEADLYPMVYEQWLIEPTGGQGPATQANEAEEGQEEVTVLPLFPVEGPSVGVPKILHQVWVGSEPPTWVQDNWEPWLDLLSGDWRVYHWTDANADQWPLAARARNHVPHPAILSDYVRLEMLYRYGGVYLDSDTRPLRSLDPLTGPDRPAWISAFSETWLPVAKRHTTVNNAAIGVPPRSRLVAEVWAEAAEALRLKPRRLSQWAGPGPWTRAREKYPLELLDEACFPGLRWAVRRKIASVKTEKLLADFPDAYAIHEYDQSWNPNAKPVHEGNALVDESRR